MNQLNNRGTQAEFGRLVGISQSAVSDLVRRDVLKPGATLGQWLLEYCGNLREVAAGRLASGGLDLVAERAALAKAQRERIELEMAERAATLVSADDVLHKWTNIIGNARGKLLALPVRLASVCAGQDAASIESASRTIIYEALTELSRGGEHGLSV